MLAARLLCSLLCLGGAGAALAQAAMTVQQLAPGVYVHQGRVEDWGPENGGDVANLGFIVGARCVAVIDTGGTPQVGERWRRAIERDEDAVQTWKRKTWPALKKKPGAKDG